MTSLSISIAVSPCLDDMLCRSNEHSITSMNSIMTRLREEAAYELGNNSVHEHVDDIRERISYLMLRISISKFKIAFPGISQAGNPPAP